MTATIGTASSRLHVSSEFEDFMSRLNALTPLFRDSAEANEAARRLVPEVDQALRDCGVLTISVPVALGGYEFSPRQIIEAIATLSRADSSTGWAVLAVQMITGTTGGWLDPDAARAYFPADGEYATFAGHGTRMGKATEVDGGYRLSGSWQFASGVHQATHIHTAALVEQTGEPRIFNLPKHEVTLSDNWDVMGLRATGSIDYTIDDVFVPHENTFPITTHENRSGGSIYRLGLANTAAMAHSGWAIGMGERLLEEMRAYATARTGTPGAITDTAQFHAEYADLEARFRAARALVLETWATNEAILDRGELLDVDQEALTRLSLNHVTSTLQTVAATVYKWAATTALRAGTLQRLFRDSHAGTQHITVSPVVLQNVGRRMAGLAPGAEWGFVTLVEG